MSKELSATGLKMLFAEPACRGCMFFRSFLLPSGRFRHFCAFTGEKLTMRGLPQCEFRQVGILEDLPPQKFGAMASKIQERRGLAAGQ